MFVLRCTRKLLRRMGPSVSPTSEPSETTTRLGDWYANLLIVRQQHLVLGVSRITLLPVLVVAAPYKTLVPRLAEGMSQMLRALNIEEAKVIVEERAMRDCVVTTTNDRRVLGSMNDFAWLLEAYLDERSMTEVALHLAEAPCGPLAMKSPRDTTLALFSTPTLHLVQD